MERTIRAHEPFAQISPRMRIRGFSDLISDPIGPETVKNRGIGPAFILGSLTALGALMSCESEPTWVDDRLERVLKESEGEIGGNAVTPEPSGWMQGSGTAFPEIRAQDSTPMTRNPPASQLQFDAMTELEEDAESIVKRMQSMSIEPEDARVLTLEESIKFATENAFDYINAEEDYLITALALMIESHRWEPRFFNDLVVDSEIGEFVGLDGRFDNALTVVNDFGVSQKLPYGGEISAGLLVGTTNMLDQFFLDSNSLATTADVVLQGDIPLLRGSGLSAREPLIQARRNLVYAARNFEEFRRTFYLGVVRSYLDLVVQQLSIENARRSVEQFRAVESRSSALVRSGRLDPFQADLAKQDTLFEIDRLSGQMESYRHRQVQAAHRNEDRDPGFDRQGDAEHPTPGNDSGRIGTGRPSPET
jgi:hypothetical protein